MPVTQADLQTAIDKLAAGEFLAVFISKDAATGDPEIQQYPRDANGDGSPMSSADAQNFLDGFLSTIPVPPQYDAETLAPVLDSDGAQVPAKTSLRHLVDWLQVQANAASKHGLKLVAGATVSDPAP